MTPERYDQINALAEAALNMSGTQRHDFLQRACGSDQDLLLRVGELLKSYDTSTNFLEAPALEAWARDVAASPENRSLVGREAGRYVILSHLGSGGIGDVWLAKDKELARNVALKLLSPDLAGDSDHARRFRQEARAASSLNHPNLVTIFDIGEFEGRQFIAQEYIEGKTVREALALGAISVESAVNAAGQVAAALSAAHGAGIVHRDIKPENIMIRPDGLVKVLDFGLARFVEARWPSFPGTMHSGLTRPGMIIGTARYMSPEQARGLPVDGRSDIFSLGVVLYEMLTGRAPFTGNTPSDVLAAILTSEPAPVSRASNEVPEPLAKVVHRCLQKDPDLRFQSAGDLGSELAGFAQLLPARAAPPPVTRARRGWYWRTVLGALLIGIASYALWRAGAGKGRPDSRVLRYSITLPPGQQLDALDISPAGDQIAYSASVRGKRTIFRRFLDEDESRPVAGGEGGEQPFFSPDGTQIGFYAPRTLRVASGTEARDIATIPAEFYLRRAFWAADGSIYYTSPSPEDGTAEGVWRVPASGGKPVLLVRSKLADKGSTVYFGQQLLGKNWLICSTNTGPLRRSIERIDIGHSEPARPVASRLVERGMGGQLLRTGHLLYLWGDRLMAARFDERAGTIGSPVEVLTGVAPNGWFGPKARVSNNGTLVYAARVMPHRRLIWLGQNGKEVPLGLPDAAYEDAEASPDGTKVAVSRRDGEDRWTLWVVDLRTKAWTLIAEVDAPRPRAIWSPDGNSLVAALTKDHAEFANLYRVPLDAPEKAERLTVQPDFGQYPLSWSVAANAILYVEGTRPGTQSDIFALSLTGREARALVTSPSPDSSPTFSKDGKWFAFSSRVQSHSEVFVQRFDQSAPARSVTRDGGTDPLWSSDGKSLYFLTADEWLMQVPIANDGSVGEPKQVTRLVSAMRADWWGRAYSAAPDGRFLVVQNAGDPAPAQIHVVVNWTEELKRTVP